VAEVALMLYVGDDWSEDHHDIGVVADGGCRLARVRLSDGVAGIAGLHDLIAAHLGEGDGPEQVLIGIETDRGPWVTALVAAGYRVYAVNPMSVARYRERHSTSGAKSDAGDAWLLADLVRTDAARHRPVAGDSPAAEGIKVLARAHLRLIWERNRTALRLRSTLREYFPAALAAFPDLSAPEALELLARAPDPAAAARLSRAQVTAALKRARRCHVTDKTAAIIAALRAPQLGQPAELTAAYAASVVALTQIIAAFSEQIPVLEAQVASSFRRHSAARIYLSQPGLGPLLGARVLGEFGDDAGRYATAKGRKNYASTSPITRASGKKTVVLARYARNDWVADAVHRWAFCALIRSPGARAYYDDMRARGKGHNAALRQLGNRLVGILHGCLKTGTCYDEHTAWGHRSGTPRPAAA
jgi:Transposase/Transposase IS116/IS110/IS902 family